MHTHSELNDPVYVPIDNPNTFQRFAASLVADVRDVPFVFLAIKLTLVVLPPAIYFYVAESFPWWAAAIYLVAIYGWFLGPYVLMLHNTSHRQLMKPRYRWLRHYIPTFLGPFFGETPNTYFVHHIGMHHPENNLEEDLSSTMPFHRDRFLHFMRYFGRFFVAIVPELSLYMWRRRRFALFRKMLIGEVSYYVVMAALLFIDWQATLVVFIIPLFVSRFAMMAGNWAQHAFIDASDPGNAYRNSITCIDCSYNRRCFNDGYHIGHHVRPNRHWSELPDDFIANRERYAAEDAIVFRNVDFFMIWAMLMLKRYDWLAHFFVDLREQKRSKEEVIALLKRRTRRVGPRREPEGERIMGALVAEA